jgi:hypothetical protein
MGLGQQCSRFHDTTLYLRGNMVEFRTAVSDVHDEELAVEHDGIWNVGYQHGGAMPTMGRVGAGRQKAIMCGQHGVKQEARMRWRNGVAEFLRCVIRFRERRPEDDWAGVDCLMEGAQKKKKKRQKKEPAVKTPDTREKKKKEGPEAKWRGKKKKKTVFLWSSRATWWSRFGGKQTLVMGMQSRELLGRQLQVEQASSQDRKDSWEQELGTGCR